LTSAGGAPGRFAEGVPERFSSRRKPSRFMLLKEAQKFALGGARRKKNPSEPGKL